MFLSLAEGQSNIKVVNGHRQQVMPFLGVSASDEPPRKHHGRMISAFGVGYCSNKERRLWGMVCPANLIQSWWAMKLLELVPVIELSTLHDCWTAMQDVGRFDSDDQRSWNRLDVGLGGRLAQIRLELLKSGPTPEELWLMLELLAEQGILPNAHELKRELELGRIADSPELQRVFATDEEQRRIYKENEIESQAPMAPEQSLVRLMSDLNLDNFCDQPFGGYGMDWGHYPLSNLDRQIKRDSLSGIFEEGSALCRSQFDSAADDLGYVRPPFFVDKEGVIYSFLRAKYEAGFILVLTRVDGGLKCHEEWYTVPQLRAMLKLPPPKVETLPVKAKKKKGTFWERFLQPA